MAKKSKRTRESDEDEFVSPTEDVAPRSSVRILAESGAESDYTDTPDTPETRDITVAGRMRALAAKLWPADGLQGLGARLRGAYRVLANAAWICTTSLLLVGLPLLFAYDREKGGQDQQLLAP